MAKAIFFILLYWLTLGTAQAAEKIWGDLTLSKQEGIQSGWTIRYLPGFKLFTEKDEGWNGQLLAQAHLEQNHQQGLSDETYEAHRLYLRAYDDHWDVRLGLQEIRFGPASILRSLQWFDDWSLSDRTNFTTGVKALLLRYDGLDNQSLWLWAMPGDTGPEKELRLAADTQSGGRLSLPWSFGEGGFTYHQSRWIDQTLEQRRGLDLFLDLGLGLWYEGSRNERQRDDLALDGDQQQTLGLDYSFLISENKLYLLWEGQRLETPNSLVERDSAMISLGLSLMDELRLIFLQERERFQSGLLEWSHTTDDWLISLQAVQVIDQINEEKGNQVILTLQWSH